MLKIENIVTLLHALDKDYVEEQVSKKDPISRLEWAPYALPAMRAALLLAR